MRARTRLFRLTATVAMAAVLSNALLPVAASARPAPETSTGKLEQNQGDPPARVGRVATTAGSASFRTASDTQWSPVTVNYPVSSGDAFWADNAAQLRLEISDSRIILAPLTEFDINSLDATGLHATVPQSQLYLRLRDLTPNEVLTLQTPRGLVRIVQPGR